MDDFRLAVKATGLSLETIQAPLIIWHGGMDSQVPVKHAEIYAKAPKALYHFLREEGHISILHNYAEQILASAMEGKHPA